MAPKLKLGVQSNVQVFVRARPFNSREEADGDRGSVQTLHITDHTCRMLNPKKEMELVREDFAFDFCFDSTKMGKGATQADVYEKIGPQMLDNCFAGYNACLFAYGQTGSGKTHTMMGDIDDELCKGIIPRMVTDYFDRVETMKSEKSARTFKLEASYLEIYCERARDLLVREVSELPVRSTPERGVFVEGLTTHKVTSARDVYKLLNQGARNRATACTNMNAHSSRSHAILTLNYTETMFASGGDQRVQTRSKNSRVYLVDLAGSERVKLSGVTGANLDEAKKINQSLTSLGRIIDMLADRKPGKPCVLPVRESLLTWLLGDSLGGNSRTIMLAAVSPSAASYDETLSTLRYASRTKCIINETSVNETVDLKLMDELRGQIDDLQEMLRNQTDLANRLQTNEEKMAALQRMLEEERLAKERSDQEQRERAEEEKRLLEEKLQLEREQLELYLGQEREQLQDKLAAALAEVERLEGWGRDMVQSAEQERRVIRDHHDRAMQDAAHQAAAEQRLLQDRLDGAARRAAELEADLRAQARERASLQALVEELQRRIADMQRDFDQKEEAWRLETASLQDKLQRATRRLQDMENTLREREIDWAKAKDDVTAHYEMELSRIQNGSNAKFTEVTQGHQQAMAALQRQSDERFQKLKDDLREQFEADVQRLQQQHDTAAKSAKQQAEEERRQMKQQHEALVQEMNAMRSANKRQQAECQWLKQQYEQSQEEMRGLRAQHEEQVEQTRVRSAGLLEQAKEQYEAECQRILHQQAEAVKEAHRKRDAALAEARKKNEDDVDRLKRAHDGKVAKLKAAHDQALTSLQSQVDAMWEHQRQEHSRMLESQASQHKMEVEELDQRLQNCEERLRQKQREVDMADNASAGALREQQERLQALERRHMDEVASLAQKLATLHRLFEQQLEASRLTEEQLRTSQRRLEAARLTAAKEAQDCRLPPEFKWALHGLKSPKPDSGPDSPCSRKSDVTSLRGTPPGSLREALGNSGLLAKLRDSSADFCSPDVRRSLRMMHVEASPVKAATPKKLWEEEEVGVLEPMGSFNGGDNSFEAHPDFQGTANDSLALF
eukprot:EG_transcript_1141